MKQLKNFALAKVLWTFLSMSVVASGCAQSYSTNLNDIQKTLIARNGSGSANGGGFEGKISVYVNNIPAQPCQQLDSNGEPLPRAEIRVYETRSLKTARLHREACTTLPLPREIPSDQISPAGTGILYQGNTFVPAPTPERPTTNLSKSSESFEDPYWDPLRTSVSSDSGTAPDGTQTADLVRDSIETGQHSLGRNFELPSNTPYTCSVFVKSAGLNRGIIQIYENSGNASVALVKNTFNLSNGSATGSSALGGTTYSAQTVAVGGGWYRVSVSGLLRSTPSAYLPICLLYLTDAAGNVNYTGDGASGMYAWGLQFEASGSISPYYSNSTKQAIGLP